MKRKIVLIVSLVAGLIAALVTRAYLTIKENEIQQEKTRLLNKYGTMQVLAMDVEPLEDMISETQRTVYGKSSGTTWATERSARLP